MDAFKNQIRDAKSVADDLAEAAPGMVKSSTFDAAFEKSTELMTRIRGLVRTPLPGELGPEERELRASILELLRQMDGQMRAALDRPPMVEQDRVFPEMVDTLRKQLDTLLLKANAVEGGRRRRKTRRAPRKSRKTRRVSRK